MAADALAARIAHLEGAYEQIDTRLGSLERKVDEGFAHLRQELTQRIDRVAEKLDTTFRWVIGVILANCADSTEFEHPVQRDSERPFRELPITQSSENDHRRSAATSRRLGDASPPFA